MKKSEYVDIIYCNNPIDGVLAVRLFPDGTQSMIRL